MNSRPRIRVIALVSLVLGLILVGLGLTMISAPIRSALGSTWLGRRLGALVKPGTPAGYPPRSAAPPGTSPPQLARGFDREAVTAEEGRRAQKTLEDLTKIADLTPAQQQRASRLIRAIEHQRTAIRNEPDTEKRRALEVLLETRERGAINSVIAPEQSPAVERYYANRSR